MKEESACEFYDKQKVQVEAANALLFLQGQGCFLEDNGQIQSQEEPDSVSSSLSSCNEEDEEHARGKKISLTRIRYEAKPVLNIPAKTPDNQSSLEALKKENMELRESVEKMSLTAASFRNDPEKVASTALTVPTQFMPLSMVNELKYVIGVAPQGVVMFVSGGSPGHVSDKNLVDSCGLLCKLLPGDVVLAERDFDIGDLVDARKAEIKITSSNIEGSSIVDSFSDRQIFIGV